MRILVTGGAGFIGANFVRYLLDHYADDSVIVLDKLTYAGSLSNLADVLAHSRFEFVQRDVCDPAVADIVRGCDVVVHFAAESHVDRSIEDASAFVDTNFRGTWRMLEAARQARVARFVQISTDEVYGSVAHNEQSLEYSPLAPGNPYAASKAAADLLVRSYVRSYGLAAIITRCSNNYGPYQFPEKFIPLMVAQALADEPLPVYGDGHHIRDWIHVWDHCRAINLILRSGLDGEIYNIGGGCALRNLEVVHRILSLLGQPRSLVRFVADRPGHDRRYSLNCDKLKNSLGWKPEWDFSQGLAQTIQWYRQNRPWLEEIRSGEYRDYFARHYVNRDALLAEVESVPRGRSFGPNTPHLFNN